MAAAAIVISSSFGSRFCVVWTKRRGRGVQARSFGLKATRARTSLIAVMSSPALSTSMWTICCSWLAGGGWSRPGGRRNSGRNARRINWPPPSSPTDRCSVPCVLLCSCEPATYSAPYGETSSVDFNFARMRRQWQLSPPRSRRVKGVLLHAAHRDRAMPLQTQLVRIRLDRRFSLQESNLFCIK
jgi:hypothetical protein